MDIVGDAVGNSEGDDVGVKLGLPVGVVRGDPVGSSVGNNVGDDVDSVGVVVGDSDGDCVGLMLGDMLGEPVGEMVGTAVGRTDGDSVGDTVGVHACVIRTLSAYAVPLQFRQSLLFSQSSSSDVSVLKTPLNIHRTSTAIVSPDVTVPNSPFNLGASPLLHPKKDPLASLRTKKLLCLTHPSSNSD